MINVVDRVPTYPNRIKVTKSDGTSEYVTWERADEPTVVGTPINKALFDSIVEDIGLNKTTTVYVSTAGSDTLGDGTAANPYLTITKALNVTPYNLNGYNVIINVTAGAYDEDVVISRMFGGTVVIDGASNADVSIRSLRVLSGVSAQLQNIILTVTNGYGGNGITVTGGEFVAMSKVRVVGAVENGVFVSRNGFFHAYDDIEINNSTFAAINCTRRSSFDARTILGSVGNGVLLRSINGSVISYEQMNATASVVSSSASGGRIYSGAQTSIPNY